MHLDTAKQVKNSSNPYSFLEVQKVHAAYGKTEVLRGVNLIMEGNQIVCIIGPNGAGKTTVFHLISDLLKMGQGRIEIEGKDITNLTVNARVKAGVCRTFQTPQLFEEMSTIETVMTGCHIHGSIGVVGSMFRIRSKLKEETELRNAALYYV